MGQKVHPHGFRIGVIKTWDSKWFADKNYQQYLLEDIKVREFVKEKLFTAGISRVEIERSSNRMVVIIHTAKPGMVIGRAGSNIELLKKDIKKMIETVNEKSVLPSWLTFWMIMSTSMLASAIGPRI